MQPPNKGKMISGADLNVLHFVSSDFMRIWASKAELIHRTTRSRWKRQPSLLTIIRGCNWDECGLEKEAATFPWYGSESAGPRTTQKGYLRQHLFELDNSFPGRFLMDSNSQELTEFDCNQSKQNTCYEIPQGGDAISIGSVVILKNDACRGKKKIKV